MTETSTTVQQGFRRKLIEAIAFRLGQEVEDAMPSDISKDSRKSILGEVLTNAQFCLSRLDIDELQNDRCIEHEIENALRIANGFVSRIRRQQKRSQQ